MKEYNQNLDPLDFSTINFDGEIYKNEINQNSLFNSNYFPNKQQNVIETQMNEQIQRVSKLYLFILDNINRYKKYQKSNAEEFFNVLKTLILNSRQSYWTTSTTKP